MEYLRQEIEINGLSLVSKTKAELTVSTGNVFHPAVPNQWDEELIAEAGKNFIRRTRSGETGLLMEKLMPSSRGECLIRV